MRHARLFTVLVVGCAGLSAQTAESLDITAVGRDSKWKVAGRTTSVVEEKGKRALKVSEGPGMGLVWLDGYQFTNGTIEVDILGRSQPVQGSFVGVAFRIADPKTHDAVYFRPFNFRAADADRKSHSVQYVSEPKWSWQVLRSQHPGQYEKPIVPAPDGDQWLHARVVLENRKISVFVNGATSPSLVVDELSDRQGGSVGLWVGEGSGGHFANLKVTKKSL